MKPTKHARTSYRMLSPFLDAVKSSENRYRKFTCGAYMPLSLEDIHFVDYKGRPVFSMAHYGEQYGDLMADPEMTFAVDFDAGEIWPRSYRNDFMGIDREVYRYNASGILCYSPNLRTDLDEFLWQWVKNILDQGFSPESCDA